MDNEIRRKKWLFEMNNEKQLVCDKIFSKHRYKSSECKNTMICSKAVNLQKKKKSLNQLPLWRRNKKEVTHISLSLLPRWDEIEILMHFHGFPLEWRRW